MKIVKRLSVSIIVVLLLILLAFLGYRYYSMPVYAGEIKLRGISDSTTVYFDTYGVPHIYAATEEDAMMSLGYVHAQDRLWQMELLRRIAAGRLSEIFGTVALESDMFFAGTGIDEASNAAVRALDKNSKEFILATAYLRGINEYVAKGPTPPEYSILGLSKRSFQLKDVYNIYGYMSFSFAMAQKTDPLLTSIRNDLGSRYLADLGIGANFNSNQIRTTHGQGTGYLAIASSIDRILASAPVASFIGSNSWVIAPGKTANGKVIFANDPHIGFSQPCTWYEAHISIPGYEMYGFYLAGTPFPLLGHNRQYAYGLTMFENDDLDFFQEQLHPTDASRYKTPAGWKKFEIKEHTIIVRDSSPVHLKIQTGDHGPVVNGLVKGLDTKEPVTMSWVYTQNPLKILEAVHGLSHAEGVADFRNSVSLIASPGLNVMYGDAIGNVAWFASGKLYKVAEGIDPSFILNGSNGIDDRRTPIPFEKNPSAVNPTWNYVYSANNQPQPIDGYLYPGYYLPRDRAMRITTLLDSKNDWTSEGVARMMNDNTSDVAAAIARGVTQHLKVNSLSGLEQAALKQLVQWDGSHQVNDIGPTIYTKLLYRLLANTFSDELGDERFDLLLRTHIIKQLPEHLVKNDRSPWWDNIVTKNRVETRTDIIRLSFRQAVSSLSTQLGSDVSQWKWGRVHIMEHKHPLGSVAALQPFFNVGTFEVPGSMEVINNLFFPFNDTGVYEVSGGPSTRRVIDFSNVDNAMSILPTGQSGNPFSPHYNDQAKMYAAGQYRTMLLDRQQIRSLSTTLMILPGNKAGGSGKAK